MKPSEIRNVLEDHEVRPSKSLGQNFLTDENVARWIVEQLEIRPQDCVVEVGPGTGSLTEHAAPLCRKLILPQPFAQPIRVVAPDADAVVIVDFDVRKAVAP